MVNVSELLFDVPLASEQPKALIGCNQNGKRAQYNLDNVGCT